MKKRSINFCGLLFWTAMALLAVRAGAGEISVDNENHKIHIRAGILERTLDLRQGGVMTESLTVAGKPVITVPTAELQMTLSLADPNRRPDQFKPGVGGEIKSEDTFKPGGQLGPEYYDDRRLGQTVRWIAPVSFRSAAFGPANLFSITTEPGEVKHLTLQIPAKKGDSLAGVTIEAHYAIDEGHPVIRKWVTVRNSGKRWIKIDRLTIEPLKLADKLPVRTPLTPAGYGVQSGVVGFANADETYGVIAASEIPSGTRWLGDDGAMGFHPDWFEWVLGPGETFTSEPVFLYAFDGAVEQTASAVSRPLDRAVEGPYMEFVKKRIGVAADTSPLDVPVWISWAQFGANVNDENMRRNAEIAARVGFATFQIDDGWQKGRLGTEPDPGRFPNMEKTCRYYKSLGLKVGLWLSCYRNLDSKDMKALPDARIVPLVTRVNGYGMSFTSPWRDYYVNDLIDLSKCWGVSYYKQDFSNILYGDVAEGHEGRTMKDSILRGLRLLLEVQDELRRRAPDLTTEITHEIYWNTPGPGADLAAIKHAARFHISPNNCTGLEPRTRPVVKDEDRARIQEATRRALASGCFMSRQRFYAHRGLPLYSLEFYGGATGNYLGCLTAQVQDRQVASWLMGTPSVFSGDMSSLTEENIKQYRQRFDTLKRLQASYDIYPHFQFSGVPEPTDEDWHWWGKLGDKGGVVVVVRGSGGAEQRKINIPWVKAEERYRLTALFADRALGEFSGKQLQEGSLELKLPKMGQELVEVAELQ